MIVAIAGIAVSIGFLDWGLHNGNPLLLIGALCLFGLSLGAVDYTTHRFNDRASDSLKILGRERIAYDEEERP